MKNVTTAGTVAKNLVLSSTLAACIGLVIAPNAYAIPTVIKDNRITDKALTPVLGRGYSISTNTFQSLCLADVQMTEPSYDFNYKFRMIESDSSSSSNTARDISSQFNISIGVSSPSFGGGIAAKSSAESSSTTAATRETQYTYVIADLTVDTYYASVDESKSPLSDSARTLLENRDIPGFFASCGPYYVRSLGRRATYLSVFRFKSVSSTSDKTFAYELANKIQGFGKASYSGATVEVGFGASSSASGSAAFSRSMSQRETTIYSVARGLGKNEDASLIAYDLDTYKEAIKQAFISMQNPGTGMVTTMEVVPWVENTDFQTTIALDTVVNTRITLDGDTGEATAEDVDTGIPNYKKKYLLNLNAEFFSEINRVDRMLLNNYYKAKTCRMQIDANWKEAAGNILGGTVPSSSLTLMPKFANRDIINHRTKEPAPLKELDTYLTDDLIESLLATEETFMFGAGGADKCINDLTQDPTTIFSRAYRDFDSCKEVRKKLAVVEGRMVGDYCMPDLYSE